MANKDIFCELVAKGVKQTDAYIKAGYSSNYSPNALKTKAYQLAKKHRAKIDAIREQIGQIAEEQKQWSRAEAINALKSVIEACRVEGDIKEKRAYISACAELNKMCGYYAPAKHDIKTAIIEDSDIDSLLKNLGYKRF